MKENTKVETFEEFKEQISELVKYFKKKEEEIQAHKKPSNKSVSEEFNVGDTFSLKSKKHKS